ncbi:PROTEIN COFACTOR ASSEMBLY OF COMPLEX C SUBUNIT B CCB2 CHLOROPLASTIC [Salix purpurea]|uniref:PROTEIN COFACTOR ASSEMBLY OF COMPLEX C SUBUNIT B CCB2 CHLOROPLASTIC n=1 Tax=Salix purpurea TaxID=77065 RepID=A0A9Q0W5Z1_SALPP|nr:PROTEIN COFACTOR ASSEMBLY OF COMPLEX C SUBUNIT B CCB2 CHLOROPLASTIC [Salix purpurea]
MSLSIHPPMQLKTHHQYRAKTPRKSIAIYASGDNPQSQRQQQQLNLSVLRFTFGIPGLDESYLPRWIGYGFGSLLILNHFLGSNSDTTQAQLRTEVLGLSLAAFSAALPYLGRFLKGAAPVDQGTLPQDAEQIFAMSQNISDAQKEDLAWATYILLRNTNTIAVLISIRGELCVRGYWKTPDNMSKDEVLGWFKEQIENIGLSDVKETLYFPRTTESEIWEMLPEGTRSLLVEPVLQATVQSAIKTENNEDSMLNFSEKSGLVLAFLSAFKCQCLAVLVQLKMIPCDSPEAYTPFFDFSHEPVLENVAMICTFANNNGFHISIDDKHFIYELQVVQL